MTTEHDNDVHEQLDVILNWGVRLTRMHDEQLFELVKQLREQGRLAYRSDYGLLDTIAHAVHKVLLARRMGL